MAERLYRDSYDVQASAYESAGDASASIKRKLKQMGVDSTILRRIAVASYEAELNLIIHSQGGQLVMEMTPEEIRLISRDVGPGIADIDQALQEGFSTASEEALITAMAASLFQRGLSATRSSKNAAAMTTGMENHSGVMPSATAMASAPKETWLRPSPIME